MCFDHHTCKLRKGVIHSTISGDELKRGRRRTLHTNASTISSYFPIGQDKKYHNHFHLFAETRSRREYNNNKLGSTAPITPEDLVNGDGSWMSSGSSASTFSPPSRTAAASGRFSRRRLNIFHMSPLLLLLVCVSLAGKTRESLLNSGIVIIIMYFVIFIFWCSICARRVQKLLYILFFVENPIENLY